MMKKPHPSFNTLYAVPAQAEYAEDNVVDVAKASCLVCPGVMATSLPVDRALVAALELLHRGQCGPCRR